MTDEQQARFREWVPLAWSIAMRMARQANQPADEFSTDALLGLARGIIGLDAKRFPSNDAVRNYLAQRITGAILDAKIEYATKRARMPTISLHVPATGTDNIELHEVIERDARRPDSVQFEDIDEQSLREMAPNLDERERRCVLMIVRGFLMREVGVACDLSESRVSQIIKRARAALRERLRAA